MGNEEKIMTMISYAGAGKMKLVEAIRTAAEGNYEEAMKLIEESDNDIALCHKAQTDILFKDSKNPNSGSSNLSVLLIHAMDQVMNTMSMCDMVKEIIDLVERRTKG